MYRQTDSIRNCSAMKEDEFPEHIKVNIYFSGKMLFLITLLYFFEIAEFSPENKREGRIR